MERIKADCRRTGYVETIFGRKCWIPGIRDANPARRAGAERQAINAPLQGSAADIIKRAMARIPAALAGAGLEARMLLQVHDELLFEVPEAEVEATAQRRQDGHGRRLRAALRTVGAAGRRDRLGQELGRGALEQVSIRLHRSSVPPLTLPSPPLGGEGCVGLARRTEPYPKLGEGAAPA